MRPTYIEICVVSFTSQGLIHEWIIISGCSNIGVWPLVFSLILVEQVSVLSLEAPYSLQYMPLGIHVHVLPSIALRITHPLLWQSIHFNVATKSSSPLLTIRSYWSNHWVVNHTDQIIELSSTDSFQNQHYTQKRLTHGAIATLTKSHVVSWKEAFCFSYIFEWTQHMYTCHLIVLKKCRFKHSPRDPFIVYSAILET